MVRAHSRLAFVLVAFLTGGAFVPFASSDSATTATRASYDDLVAQARTAIQENRLQDAVARSEEAIGLDDKRWEGYVVAASGYSGQKLYDDAIGMLQMALVRAPQERKPLVRDAIAEARRLAGGGQSSPASAGSASAATSSAPEPTQAEIVLWKTIENSSNIADFKGYLQKYPNGTFAPVASARIEKFEEEVRRTEQAEADRKMAAAQEQQRKLQEQAQERQRQIEERKTNPRVIHQTFWGYRGVGNMRITEEGAVYAGTDGTISIAKSNVEYIDESGGALRIITGGKKLWFIPCRSPCDWPDSSSWYPAWDLGRALGEKWGWNFNEDGTRVVPPVQ